MHRITMLQPVELNSSRGKFSWCATPAKLWQWMTSLVLYKLLCMTRFADQMNPRCENEGSDIEELRDCVQHEFGKSAWSKIATTPMRALCAFQPKAKEIGGLWRWICALGSDHERNPLVFQSARNQLDWTAGNCLEHKKQSLKVQKRVADVSCVLPP